MAKSRSKNSCKECRITRSKCVISKTNPSICVRCETSGIECKFAQKKVVNASPKAHNLKITKDVPPKDTNKVKEAEKVTEVTANTHNNKDPSINNKDNGGKNENNNNDTKTVDHDGNKEKEQDKKEMDEVLTPRKKRKNRKKRRYDESLLLNENGDNHNNKHNMEDSLSLNSKHKERSGKKRRIDDNQMNVDKNGLPILDNQQIIDDQQQSQMQQEQYMDDQYYVKKRKRKKKRRKSRHHNNNCYYDNNTQQYYDESGSIIMDQNVNNNEHTQNEMDQNIINNGHDQNQNGYDNNNGYSQNNNAYYDQYGYYHKKKKKKRNVDRVLSIHDSWSDYKRFNKLIHKWNDREMDETQQISQEQQQLQQGLELKTDKEGNKGTVINLTDTTETKPKHPPFLPLDSAYLQSITAFTGTHHFMGTYPWPYPDDWI